MAAPNQLAFVPEEKILCFHGPMLYEAKVLKTELWEQSGEHAAGPHYFVHYKGWKQTWDEWVPQSRILKWNDENLKRQKELTQMYASKKSSKQKERQTGDTGTDRGKKRKSDVMEKEEEYLRKPEIKLPIPDMLKLQLVDDWEFITNKHQLVPLPREPTVRQILQMYQTSKSEKSRKSRADEILSEVITGLQLYFDKALGTILLYRFERQQYVDIRKNFPDKEMSEIYGAEHLLRLFVQLPSLIAHTNMDQDAIATLKDNLSEFLTWMEKKKSDLFLQMYENATPEYMQLQKSN
ncbi:MRG-domain-containing protein [Paraphysoderma sedebokerense]|nr:MRG-domain-containing protein [Paraphysoderma sedebokerense]